MHQTDKKDIYTSMSDIPFMPEKPMLARAYVPFQKAEYLFSPEKGLMEGTIFPDLVRPYMKDRCERDYRRDKK